MCKRHGCGQVTWLQVATWWQIEQPLSPYAVAVLFTQLLGPDGLPLAQADRLDVPTHSWRAGDSFIQLHEFHLPPTTVLGEYALIGGLYTLPEGRRVSVSQDGETVGDTFPLGWVEVVR